MIHRFVDIVAAPYTGPIIPYIINNTSLQTWAIWMAGNDATPFQVDNSSFGSAVSRIFDPSVTDGAETILYIWQDNTASSVRDRIYVTPGDNSDPQVEVARNPSNTSAQDSFQRATPIWRPDGDKIFYMGENTFTAHLAEIRSVDPDGSNNTLVYDRAGGGFLSNQTGFDLSINEDGTILAWWDRKFSGAAFESDGGLWVCNTDGTGDSHIVSQLDTDQQIVKGFAHASDTIAYQLSNTDLRIVPASGGSPTNLSPSASFMATGRRCWTPDDTQLYGLRLDAYGSDPKHVVAFLDTDGSGTITDLSPERRLTVAFRGRGPELGWDNRLYWHESGEVVSTELDGSDYKVDHDLGVNQVFKGFHGDSVN